MKQQLIAMFFPLLALVAIGLVALFLRRPWQGRSQVVPTSSAKTEIDKAEIDEVDIRAAMDEVEGAIQRFQVRLQRRERQRATTES
jgi:hypothetical protein